MNSIVHFILSTRDPTRVCKVCFERINSLRTPHAASLVNTLERDTDQAHRNLTSSSEPINTFPGKSTSMYV